MRADLAGRDRSTARDGLVMSQPRPGSDPLFAHEPLADRAQHAHRRSQGAGTRALGEDDSTDPAPGADLGAVLAVRSDALRPALMRFFGRKGVPASEIDDLVQDVFLRIVRRGGAEVQNIDGYAYAVAASVLADRARSRAIRLVDAHMSLEPELHASEDAAADRILAGRIELRETTRILLELPELTRRVFVLRRLEGLSFAEITLRLGISLSAAEKHMLRASRHLVARSGDRP